MNSKKREKDAKEWDLKCGIYGQEIWGAFQGDRDVEWLQRRLWNRRSCVDKRTNSEYELVKWQWPPILWEWGLMGETVEKWFHVWDSECENAEERKLWQEFLKSTQEYWIKWGSDFECSNSGSNTSSRLEINTKVRGVCARYQQRNVRQGEKPCECAKWRALDACYSAPPWRSLWWSLEGRIVIRFASVIRFEWTCQLRKVKIGAKTK